MPLGVCANCVAPIGRGVALPYVVTILCTLGIYSVYSFLVVGKTISRKIAAAAGGAVATLGMLAGLAAMELRYRKKRREITRRIPERRAPRLLHLSKSREIHRSQ
jgi:hypothetical protein